MKKLLLVGGGHSHLYILKRLQQASLQGVEVTLLSPDPYQYYSGMFSGYAEGLYSIDDIRVNLVKLAKQAGVKWVQGAVTSIDPNQKTILTASGDIVVYDVISFDIGSLTAGIHLLEAPQIKSRIKPNYHFIDVIDRARTSRKVVIVGGGAAGIEIALSLTAWREKKDIKVPITLISATRLLAQERHKTSSKIENIVKSRGIQLIPHTKVNKVQENSLLTSTKNKIDFDQLIWLTGPKSHDLFKTSKLPVDKEGYLLVEDTLQVKEYPSIFGAGDCISIRQYPNIPKVGVYAVKQGPILFKNIEGFLTEGDGERYIPQKQYLSILSTGHKKGLVLYRNFHFYSSWAWKLKNRIDSKFIQKYQL